MIKYGICSLPQRKLNQPKNISSKSDMENSPRREISCFIKLPKYPGISPHNLTVTLKKPPPLQTSCYFMTITRIQLLSWYECHAPPPPASCYESDPPVCPWKSRTQHLLFLPAFPTTGAACASQPVGQLDSRAEPASRATTQLLQCLPHHNLPGWVVT